MASNSHDLQKDIKKYKNIYYALLVFTVITVLAGKLHLTLSLTIILALLIASFKASLVASFFMHLSSEKPVIYWILIGTVIGFFSMIVLIYVSHHSVYEGMRYVP